MFAVLALIRCNTKNVLVAQQQQQQQEGHLSDGNYTTTCDLQKGEKKQLLNVSPRALPGYRHNRRITIIFTAK